MEVLNSWEKKGLAQGKREGEEEMVVELLDFRFGALETNLEQRVRKLPSTRLKELSKALFGFTSLADLQIWLEQHK